MSGESRERLEVVCRHCNHSPNEHNLYGCGHWFTTSEWGEGMCGCSWDAVPASGDRPVSGESLPTPPPGTWWEITGTPQGPWTWAAETFFEHDTNGFAVSVDYLAVASAPGATAIWRTEAS